MGDAAMKKKLFLSWMLAAVVSAGASYAAASPECWVTVKCNNDDATDFVSSQPFPLDPSHSFCMLKPADRENCRRICHDKSATLTTCTVLHRTQPPQVPGGPP
jgi:hypothetical protein